MTANTIPVVGTTIPYYAGDALLSRDDKTYIVRIAYTDGVWTINHPEKKLGLLVWLNDAPDEWTTHVKITAIAPSGTSVWGDPVDLGAYDKVYD